MRLNHILAAFVLLVSCCVLQASAQDASVAGEILVKFQPGAAAAAKAEAHRVGRGRVLAEIAQTRVQRIAVSPGDEAAALARYRRNPNVVLAEPNFIRTIPPAAIAGSAVPGDALFGLQWGLNNTGQSGGAADADIDAPEAWNVTTGLSTNIKVAVIDTGVDYAHPDLAANYAGGEDFTTTDHNPMDDHGHGTHVAGTIAAAINNLTSGSAEGVAGVAPNALILGYKVCLANGTCSDFAIQQGIARAIADGAKVINMSLGSAAYSQSTNDAVQNAWQAGIVIVAAAGNGNTTAQFYPAAHPNVVSVAAFDSMHRRSSFSNYGAWVDVSAPGTSILSSYRMSACAGQTPSPGDTGCYAWMSGTSMASPHVAGAAALVWSRADVTSNAQVVDILLNSADPQGAGATRLDSWTVRGGLNLGNAVSLGASNLPPTAEAGANQTVTDTDRTGEESIALNGGGSSDPDGEVISYEWREGGMVLASQASPTLSLSVGTHLLLLEVTDNDGAKDTDTVTVIVNPGNVAPVASNTSVTTTVGTPVTLTLNAADAGTCELIFSIVQGPSGGSLGSIQPVACVSGSPNSDSARVTYTPSGAGTFNLTFTAGDGHLVSNTATASITVNPAPPATPLAVTAITPNVVPQTYGTKPFVITGSGFVQGATVSLLNGSGAAPRVVGVAWASAGELTATIEIRAGGPKKSRQWDVVVTNPNGSSATGARLLTITP